MKHADLISRSKERSRKMNNRRLLQQAFGLTLAVLLLAGCGGAPAVPTASATAPGATSLPEPTLVSFGSVPGVDEPIVVEDIGVEDSAGLTRRGDLELLISDAYTEESRQSGDSPPVYPDDPSDIFFTLELDLDGPSNCIDWVAQNTRLVYGEEEYRAVLVGIKVEEGYLAGWHIVFTVPEDSEFGRYVLRLPDGRAIELTAFFE
jgi:hypothetical protein